MFNTKGTKAKDTPITKEFILSRVQEEDVFRQYLNISIEFGTLVCSPLREDRSPTCTFTRGATGIYFKDFSGDFHGDCFDVVMRIYGCNFATALKTVARDMGLLGDNPLPALFNIDKSARKAKFEQHQKVFQTKKRPWNKVDKAFWTQFGVGRVNLEKFYVFPLENLWIDGDLQYTYHPNDPAYAYYFGYGKYKVYFPKRRTMRFLSNGPHLQGWNQLDLRAETVLITKSLKDVIVLDVMGFTAIAPHSEGALVKPGTIELLENYDLCLFFDNDETGIKWAKNNSLEYGLPYFYLDKVKDVSDLVKAVGLNEAKETITNHLNNRKYVKETNSGILECNWCK